MRHLEVQPRQLGERLRVAATFATIFFEQMFLLRRREADGGSAERDRDGQRASNGDLERHLLLAADRTLFRGIIESPKTVAGWRTSSIETTGTSEANNVITLV